MSRLSALARVGAQGGFLCGRGTNRIDHLYGGSVREELAKLGQQVFLVLEQTRDLKDVNKL